MFLTDKFTYISISRVATRSIRRKLETLEQQFPADIKSYGFSTFHLINEVFKNNKLPYTFAFVRNPISRCLSLYRHAKREEWFTGDFKEYVELLDCYFNDLFSNRHLDKVQSTLVVHKNTTTPVPGQTWGFENILQEAIPQHYYLFKNDNSTHVNFIGKYESLERDWSIVVKNIYDRTNFNMGGTLPFLNERSDSMSIDFPNKLFKCEYTLPSELIDDETHNLIYKIYKKDFKLLGYKKDIPAAKSTMFELKPGSLNDLVFDIWKVGSEKGEESEEFLDLWDKLIWSFSEQMNSWNQPGVTDVGRLEQGRQLDTTITNHSEVGQKFPYFINSVLFFNLHLLEKTIVHSLTPK